MSGKKQDRKRYVKRFGDAVIQQFRKSNAVSSKSKGIIVSINVKNLPGGPMDENNERAVLTIYKGKKTLSTLYTYQRSYKTNVKTAFLYMAA